MPFIYVRDIAPLLLAGISPATQARHIVPGLRELILFNSSLNVPPRSLFVTLSQLRRV